MGLGKWWITHGPGSPGSVAKAMAMAYSRLKAYYPTASQDELLLATLRSRYSEGEIDNATANKIVKDSKGRLAELTYQVIILEIPAASGAMLNAPDVYGKMLEVIDEVTAKFTPEHKQGPIVSKVDEGLRMLQILVESAGGSIEPVRHLLRRNHSEVTSKVETALLEELRYTVVNGFFHCAARNITFTDLSRIKKFYGRTLEENYPEASPTFMKLARTYWTFKVILIECIPDPSVCVNLLQDIEIDFAGVFFPTPGISPPKELRETTMRTLIEQSGADLDVEDYIRGNFYLR